jgi:signal transduction histidine kinase
MKSAGRQSFIQQNLFWQDSQSRLDVAIALIVGVVAIVGTLFAAQRQPDRTPIDALAIVLILAAAASLLFRRRYPGWVLIFANGIAMIYLFLNYPKGPIFLTTIIAFISAVMHGRRLLAWVVLVAEFVLFHWLPFFLGNESAPSYSTLFGLAGWLVVLAAGTEIVYIRQQRVVRIREEEARRRAGEERLRIARDLHDVLGHHISLITVQAGVALHLMDKQPEQARDALTVIRETSKEALHELRSVLDVLRQGNEAPPRAPTPGLAGLDDLVARAADAGLQVQTEVSGDIDTLPASVDSAAYRIVQEALTNVLRHSGQVSSRVLVNCSGQELSLQIDNAAGMGGAPDALGSGQGILGMQERAAALGGMVSAGPQPDGGYRVLARLPLNGGASTVSGAEQ